MKKKLNQSLFREHKTLQMYAPCPCYCSCAGCASIPSNDYENVRWSASFYKNDNVYDNNNPN